MSLLAQLPTFRDRRDAYNWAETWMFDFEFRCFWFSELFAYHLPSMSLKLSVGENNHIRFLHENIIVEFFTFIFQMLTLKFSYNCDLITNMSIDVLSTIKGIRKLSFKVKTFHVNLLRGSWSSAF